MVPKLLYMQHMGLEDLQGIENREFNFKKCKYIHLQENNLENLTGIHCLKKLRDLYIMKNPLVHFPEKMPHHLVKIEMTDTLVNDLTPLTQCKLLKKLIAANCKNLTDISPLSRLPELENLNVNYTNVRDFDCLIDGFPKLHALEINGIWPLNSLKWVDHIKKYKWIQWYGNKLSREMRQTMIKKTDFFKGVDLQDFGENHSFLQTGNDKIADFWNKGLEDVSTLKERVPATVTTMNHTVTI
eukprot:UN06532